MAGIVASVLVIFVTLYVMITVLPTISLDCPYRTPLSAIFWRFIPLHWTQPHRHGAGSSRAAAQSPRRTRCPLDTGDLTDNTGLLPFVEATHEIIDGPTGLRGVDDHLFRLVLQTADPHTSLPRRILSLLWSAETLPLHDPLRDRRQTASLRALWALGIVTARITRGSANDVYIGCASLYGLHIPEMYRLSVNAVISYVHSKSIQARFEDIRAMFSAGDVSVPREQTRLILFLRTTVPTLDHDCQREGIMRKPMEILRRLAESDPDEVGCGEEFAAAVQCIDEVHEISRWPVYFAKFAIGLIVPDAMTVPVHLLPSRALPHTKRLPAALHAMLDHPSQNDLDVIMRCSLRLSPLLDQNSFVPIIYWYLGNRTGDANWQYALGDCRLDVLAKTIATDITEKDVLEQPVLCGLVRLWSVGNVFNSCNVSYGLSYIDGCVQHAEDAFHAQRILILSSATLARSTSTLSDLEAALGGRSRSLNVIYGPTSISATSLRLP
ncbi:hypothetical protein K438DRAFT_1963604 [Mycena galopus ATCC 62051]|nr:hypothetical protein K438DRAFT_1963604 [Mycena galopus ATCC 62051]